MVQLTANDLRFLEPGWKPKCKEDVVELLFLCQAGLVSCRKVSDILFPQFNGAAKNE